MALESCTTPFFLQMRSNARLTIHSVRNISAINISQATTFCHHHFLEITHFKLDYQNSICGSGSMLAFCLKCIKKFTSWFLESPLSRWTFVQNASINLLPDSWDHHYSLLGSRLTVYAIMTFAIVSHPAICQIPLHTLTVGNFYQCE